MSRHPSSWQIVVEEQAHKQPLRDLQIIIPIYNMASYVEELLQACYRHLLPLGAQLWLIDDGSQDNLSELLARPAHQPYWQETGPCHYVAQAVNQGRFAARYTGARLATAPWLLFLDARVGLDERLPMALQHWLSRKQSLAVVGWVEIDGKRSIYHAYWDALHRRLYPAHYSHVGPFVLTEANYDTMLKGTGVLLVQRAVWLQLCASYQGDRRSDDTWLLRQLLAQQPLWIDPQLVITWQPRQQLGSYLLRWWERGPSFVAYHVRHRLTPFGQLARSSIVAALCLLPLMCFLPWLGAMVLLGFGLMLLLTSWWIAGRWSLALRFLPLHGATTIVFGCAVAWAWLFGKRSD